MVTQASELITQQLLSAIGISAVWGDIVINVKAKPFAAKGDGVTDDTIAIQGAIDYAISIGKHEVTFPPGTYKYGVLFNTSGITFVGDGVTLDGTTPITLVSYAALQTNATALKADVTQRGINVCSAPYNADPTGVLFSSDAIQNAVLSGASEIAIPPGIYKMDKKITIATPVTIRGYGEVTIKLPNKNSFAAFEVKSSNVVFENIKIIETSANFEATASSIAVNPASDISSIIFDNVRVTGSKGIEIVPTSGTVRNVTFNNCVTSYSGRNGVWCNNCEFISFYNHEAQHNWLDGIKTEKTTFDVKVFGGNLSYNGESYGHIAFGNGSGVDLYAGGNKALLNGVTCDHNNGQGIHILSSIENDIDDYPTSNPVRFNQIIGCHACNNLADGLDISNVASPNPLGPLPSMIAINGGVFNNNGDRGIDLDGSKFVTISGATCFGNQRAGIIMRNSFYVDVQNCTIVKNSQEGAGTNAGIEIITSKHVKIIGGYINGAEDNQARDDDETSLTAYHLCGISVNSLTCDDVLISYVGIKNYTNGKSVTINDSTDPSVATKRIIIHYGDVGTDTISNLTGYYGSTLYKSGVLYTKNNNINSSSWRSAARQVEGTFTGTGNGSSKNFSVAHGLGVTPRRFHVSGRNDASAANFSVFADSTNVTVTFVAAPANLAALSFNYWADAQ